MELASLVGILGATAYQPLCKIRRTAAPLPHMVVARIKCIGILKVLGHHLAHSAKYVFEK